MGTLAQDATGCVMEESMSPVLVTRAYYGSTRYGGADATMPDALYTGISFMMSAIKAQ